MMILEAGFVGGEYGAAVMQFYFCELTSIRERCRFLINS